MPESPSGAIVGPILASVGDLPRVAVDGRSPLDLGDGSVWLVTSGEIDVFAQTERSDGTYGARQHWLRLTAGSLVIGLDASVVPDGVRLIAVGLPGTEVVEAGRDRTLAGLAAADEETRRAFHAALHAWNAAVVAQAPVGSDRAGIVRVIAGAPTELAADQRATSGSKHGWLRVDTGAYRLLGASPPIDADDAVLPLTPPLSLQATARTVLADVDPLDADPQALLDGVERIACVRIRAVATQVAEGDATAASADARAARREEWSYRVLASVLGSSAEGRIEEGEPRSSYLQAALEQLGKALRVEMPRLADLRLDRSDDPLAAVAEAAEIRVRRVGLPDRWWRETSGPLLVFRKDHRPLAVLPQTSRSYRWFDPEAGTWRRVDESFASDLRHEAVSFYERLPDGTVGIRELIAFTLRGTGRSLATICVSGLALAILALVVPLATSVVYGTVIPRGSVGLLWSVVVVFTAMAITSALLGVTEGLSVLRATGQAQANLQPALWDRLLRLPMRFYRQYTVGDLANRVDGVDTMREVLTGQGVQSVVTFLFSAVSLGLMFVLSWQLALVSVAALGFVSLTVLALNLWRVNYIRKALLVRGTVSGLVFQLLEAVPKLRVSGAEERALAAWARAFRPQIEAGYSAGLIQAWLTGFVAIITAFISLGTYALAGSSYLDISPATFLAFTAALGQLIASATSFNSQLAEMVQVIPLYERFRPILREEPERAADEESPGELTGEVSLDQVTFRYQADGPRVLQDVSIDVAPGEFVAITGPSGAGKSTIIQLLLGFETPEKGAIRYNRTNLVHLRPVEVRRQIGTVLQNGMPITGPASQVILGDSGGSIDDAWRAAEIADLADDIRAMPMAMNTMVSEGGTTWSGGQIQRLNIARAIAMRPKVILMDEATSSLDTKTQAAVSAALDELDATRIVVAHRLSTIRAADRIVVLDGGRVVQVGTYDELLARPGLFQRLARRQLVDDPDHVVT